MKRRCQRRVPQLPRTRISWEAMSCLWTTLPSPPSHHRRACREVGPLRRGRRTSGGSLGGHSGAGGGADHQGRRPADPPQRFAPAPVRPRCRPRWTTSRCWAWGCSWTAATPNPRNAVHLVWAGERVRPEYELPSPPVEQRQELSGIQTVSLPGLVLMKLLSNRDQDRVHLRDLIDVGLVGRELFNDLPPTLAERLAALLSESGR